MDFILLPCSEVVALELVRRLAPASAAVSARMALPDSGGIELRLDAVPTLLNADLPATKCAHCGPLLCLASERTFSVSVIALGPWRSPGVGDCSAHADIGFSQPRTRHVHCPY